MTRSKRKSSKSGLLTLIARNPWWTVIVLVLIVLFTYTLSVYQRGRESAENDDVPQENVQHKPAARSNGKLLLYPGRSIKYATQFNYKNATHIAAATRVGLPRPMKDQADVNRHKNKLVRIATTKNYKLDDLEYSLPYLTPKASAVLDDICADFAEILKRNNLPHYRPIVTSVLRTEDSVKRLRRSGNVNATTNSAHCYGTTFDITYTRFDKNDSTDDYMNEENLKLVLAQALLNAQRAGKIYVKYEYKQCCFHITSRK